MPWIYRQSTGELERGTLVFGRVHVGAGRLSWDLPTPPLPPEHVGDGYSGTGEGRNKPAQEGHHNVGPIPHGRYQIGRPYNTHDHGPLVMRLTPVGHDALGRSGFLIHGDNRRHDASQGCIILPPNIREQISRSGDNELVVVP